VKVWPSDLSIRVQAALTAMTATGHVRTPEAVSPSAVTQDCLRRVVLDVLAPADPGRSPDLERWTAFHNVFRDFLLYRLGGRNPEYRFGPVRFREVPLPVRYAADGLIPVGEGSAVVLEVKSTEWPELLGALADPALSDDETAARSCQAWLAQAVVGGAVANAHLAALRRGSPEEPVPAAEALRAGPLRGALVWAFDRFDPREQAFRIVDFESPEAEGRLAEGLDRLRQAAEAVLAARQAADPWAALPPAFPPGAPECARCPFDPQCHERAVGRLLGQTDTLPPELAERVGALPGLREVVRSLERQIEAVRREVFDFMQAHGLRRAGPAVIRVRRSDVLRDVPPAELLRGLLDAGGRLTITGGGSRAAAPVLEDLRRRGFVETIETPYLAIE